ncbi:hypothetical protein HNQ59_002991 [Chitinivorax tropicus]|uniref:Putative DNA-binding domain-containing protein n=1 Tax=Chitinivorax tropicus TaxID=714531 RepID=A0A840MTR3_9PROT|nr:DNA-binding domain-containing protein [Chitinivorax tropicus]MBB5019683.1 hypothetical protein [Chitinivorax tropicus]
MNPLLSAQGRFADAVIHGTVVESEWGRYLNGLSAYANNRLFNRIDALSDAFPTVKAIVGEAFFEGLARGYAKCMASHSGNIHHYGDVFSAFLRQFEPASVLPYLPDVAALDWAMRRAFFAPDASPIDLMTLASVPMEQHGELVATIHPAAAMLHAAFPVVAIFQAHHGGPWPDLEQAMEETALVYRTANQVKVRAISGAERVFCTGLMTGESLGASLSAALQHDQSFVLGSLLMQLVADELVTSLNLPG